MEAALAKNLPRRSRSHNGFTHGRVGRVKDMGVLTGKTRVWELAGAGAAKDLMSFLPSGVFVLENASVCELTRLWPDAE